MNLKIVPSEDLKKSLAAGVQLAGELDKMASAVSAACDGVHGAERRLTDARVVLGDAAAAGAVDGGQVTPKLQADLSAAMVDAETAKAKLGGLQRLRATREAAIPKILSALEAQYAVLAPAVCEKWVDDVARPAERTFRDVLEAAGVAVVMPAVTVGQVDAAKISREARATAEAIATMRAHQSQANSRKRVEQLNGRASPQFQTMRGQPFRVTVDELYDSLGKLRHRNEILIGGQDIDLFSAENFITSMGGSKLRAAE